MSHKSSPYGVAARLQTALAAERRIFSFSVGQFPDLGHGKLAGCSSERC